MKHIFRRALAGLTGLAIAFSAAPASADGIRNDPLARFSAPVCPGVFGLARESAGVMIDRVRRNLEELDIRLAPDGACEANLIIAVVADGQEYLDRVEREQGYLFDPLTRSERTKLMSQPGPARVWIQTAQVTRDGIPVGVRENLVEVPNARMWSAHSRIYVPTRRDISRATILIDREAAEGLTIGQIADYATLYGLSERVPAFGGDVDSIQTLFEDGTEGSTALTAVDRAFLNRLYTLPPNLPATALLEGLPQSGIFLE